MGKVQRLLLVLVLHIGNKTRKNLKHPLTNIFSEAVWLLVEQHSTGQHVGALEKKLIFMGGLMFNDKGITYRVSQKYCNLLFNCIPASPAFSNKFEKLV